MTQFSSISIIYNPKSSGDGKAMAQNLYHELKGLYNTLPITLIATKRAGHAQDLTYHIACKYDRPLIISVSGDGGYNEVINGAVRAYQAGFKPITGLVPAGNANDHHGSVSHPNIITAIKKGLVQKIDLLQLSVHSGQHSDTYYAHSYIGFGLTPQIGKELTKTKLNRFNEAALVLKGLMRRRAVNLKINNKVSSYDSVTISNIDRMAKVLTLTKDSQLDDGLFAVHTVRQRSLLSKLRFVLTAATVGISDSLQLATYSMTTVQPTLVQLDGEVITLAAEAQLTISISKQQLSCL